MHAVIAGRAAEGAGGTLRDDQLASNRWLHSRSVGASLPASVGEIS